MTPLVILSILFGCACVIAASAMVKVHQLDRRG